MLVQWGKVLLMITIKIFLVLKSDQGDVIDTFLHADIGEGENVYINMPKCFEQYSKTGHKKFLKLKKMIYGLCQSPRTFWKYLMNNLE